MWVVTSKLTINVVLLTDMVHVGDKPHKQQSHQNPNDRTLLRHRVIQPLCELKSTSTDEAADEAVRNIPTPPPRASPTARTGTPAARRYDEHERWRIFTSGLSKTGRVTLSNT
jgi:hypothetical protein